MKLDAAAVRALNILPSALDAGNRTMSIAGLLNKCKTPQVCISLVSYLSFIDSS